MMTTLTTPLISAASERLGYIAVNYRTSCTACTLDLAKCHHDDGDLHRALFSLTAPTSAAIQYHCSDTGFCWNNHVLC